MSHVDDVNVLRDALSILLRSQIPNRATWQAVKDLSERKLMEFPNATFSDPDRQYSVAGSAAG